jgi:hypothetical protein
MTVAPFRLYGFSELTGPSSQPALPIRCHLTVRAATWTTFRGVSCAEDEDFAAYDRSLPIEKDGSEKGD